MKHLELRHWRWRWPCRRRPAQAGEPVNLMLNWTPTADHSPFYYAKAQGWYEKAGIDLTIETGKGSGVSSLKVGSGGSPFGIADLATMLVARSKGADVVALMSIYANTGQTFYWLKSYGVDGAKDFPGHKIGNPPGDASRVMWPAFAKAAGIAPDCGDLRQCRPDREDRGAEEPHRRHHQRLLQRARSEGDRVRRRPRLRQLEGHRPQPLRQLADRQRRLSGEEPEAGGGFRPHQPEGLRRLRRRRHALPEGAARSGLGSRQGKPGTAVGAHQVPDDRRVHHHQGAGLDRSPSG